MRVRMVTPALVLALAAAAVSGCGSSSKKTTSKPSNGAATASTGGVVPSRTYTVKLTGSAEVPAGAPQGSGTATIRLLGSKHQVCWTFRNLRGVVKPGAAHIHKGAAGASGPIVIPFGGAYKPAGCASGVSTSLLRNIVAAPKGFYVNVHNAKYPGGAVRAQL